MKTLCEEKLRLPTLNIVCRTLRSERGVSLVVVIMLMVIILAITGAGLLFSSIDLRVSGNYRAGTQAFYAADTGASVGFGNIVLNPAASVAAIPKTETAIGSGLFYCSGTIANTGVSCATPQPLVSPSIDYVPTQQSLSASTYNTPRRFNYQYQIDATGVLPGSSTRQVQALARYGPLQR